MKNIISIIILMLMSHHASATDEFTCYGELYSASFIVSHHPEETGKAAEVQIHRKGQFMGVSLNDHEFIENDIYWVNREGDYSRNGLNVKLKNRTDGSVTSVKAEGVNGVLYYKGKSYALECEWEG